LLENDVYEDDDRIVLEMEVPASRRRMFI